MRPIGFEREVPREGPVIVRSETVAVERCAMEPLLIGIAAIAFSVVIQTTAVSVGVAILEALIRRRQAQGSFWNIMFVLQLMVFLLLAAHLVQMAFWALVFVWCDQFPDFGTAFCHSAVNYTTLGYGDVVMAGRWRLLGPMEAMDGMLMAGVSAAILFAVLHRLVEHRLADPQAVGGRNHADRRNQNRE